MDFADSSLRPPAAADLGERVGARLRKGCGFLGAAAVYTFAADVLVGLDPEGSYRAGLEELNVPQAEIDAAVASIVEGKHPIDSFPGQAIHYEAQVAGEAEEQEDRDRAFRCEGEAHAARHLLSMVGVTIEPRKQIFL